MKVLTPKGILLSIAGVLPVVEKRVSFNGSEVRLCQLVKDKYQTVTGLYLTTDAEEPCTDISENFLVGNLKPVVANDIMHCLLEKGYYDFSQLDYQEKVGVFENYTFDEGISKPYYVEGCLLSMYSPTSTFSLPVAGVFPDASGVDDDLSSFSDEDLRAVIYELEDMTMAELASMSRVELEKEYKNIKVGDLDE